MTEDCTYLETNIDFSIQGETFSFQGKEIINPGFTRVYPFTVISSDDQIPQVKQGANYSIIEVISILNTSWIQLSTIEFFLIYICNLIFHRKSYMNQKQNHQIT